MIRITESVEVAPLAGAWIETHSALIVLNSLMSHPSRVRGSKLYDNVLDIDESGVAPLAGAWIETLIRFQDKAP